MSVGLLTVATPEQPCTEMPLFTPDGKLAHAMPRSSQTHDHIRAFVIGDFGVDTKENSKQEWRSDFDVAKRNDAARWMGWYSEPQSNALPGNNFKSSPDFVVNVGDSFYQDGIRNTTDNRWNTTYEHIFAKPNNIYWYSVLGNHDWYGNEQDEDSSGTISQINYTHENPYNKWCMPDYNYTLTTTVTGSHNFKVKFVFIDTQSMLLDSEGGCRNASNDFEPSRRRTCCRGEEIPVFNDQIKWIKQQVCNRDGFQWVVVVGHHPLVSAGLRIRGSDTSITDSWIKTLFASGDVNETVRDRLLSKFIYDPYYLNTTMGVTLTDLLSTCGVDLYLSGHEHMTQVLTHKNKHSGHTMGMFAFGDSGKANLLNALIEEPDSDPCRITGQCFANDETVKNAWGDEWNLHFKDYHGGFADLRIHHNHIVLDTISSDGVKIDQFTIQKYQNTDNDSCSGASIISTPVLIFVALLILGFTVLLTNSYTKAIMSRGQGKHNSMRIEMTE